MRPFVDDVRHAVRLLIKHPRLVAAIVLPLALGIGANSAVFGMVDAVLFRPLPVREADRLIRVYAVFEQNSSALDSSSYPAYLTYRDAATVVAGLAAFSEASAVNLSTRGGTTERVSCSIRDRELLRGARRRGGSRPPRRAYRRQRARREPHRRHERPALAPPLRRRTGRRRLGGPHQRS